ncbi:hypothetical protein EKO04_010847 [Ascochyta lentis]|uniref:Uncharacterized protein n=1 Tax=Ascochyta lentis TaxID=205686 RepID=A0A8H7MBK0_9PLEO|nr:hypothetical protein EKO04_010847 [Ascochyta lentis]
MMFRRLLAVAAITIFAQPSLAVRTFTSPEQLPTTEYDFVVVGGGTAGLVVASRLSEQANITVLVVEAGGNDREFPDAEVLFLASRLQHTGADWNYTTTPQEGYNNRSISFERGHVLGGSSTVNYMAYNRASNNVYDRWANITGDVSWSWSALKPYYLKNSRLVAPADGRDYADEVIESAHGNGPIEVSVPGNPYPLDRKAVEASRNLGGRYAFNQDLNAGDFVGFSWSQSSIANWKRSSAATAYLHPLIDNCQGNRSTCRDNLTILLNTQVTRLLSASDVHSCPSIVAAEIAQSSTSKQVRVTAHKELVLSAGVIGTPKILMQSGIGPVSTLSSLNISTLVDLPSVGQNLTDHPLNALYFAVNANTTVDTIMQNPAVMEQALQTWNDTHRGPLTNSASNIIAMLRLPQNATIFDTVSDPAAGPLSGNEELLFAEGFVPLANIPMPSTGNYISVLSIVTSPTSRGEVTLNSSDLFAPPIINPNYLTSEFDQYAAVQAMKDAFTVLGTKAFEGYVGAPYGPLANLTSDEDYVQYVRQHAVTINHGTGTAKMAPYGADWGVVNPDLTLKGASGLRIVDASVFPEIPECHTMAPVYIVAERAAAIIKDAYGLGV